MRSSRQGSRGPRSFALLVHDNQRAIAVFLAIFMIVAMVVGQARFANAKDTNEIGADSSGSATASNNNGGGGGGSTGGGTTTGDDQSASDETVVRPTGSTADAAEKAEQRRELRRERKAERRVARRDAGRETAPVDHQVTICHRTDSYSNPYIVNTPDISSSGHLTGGHDQEHLGPLFYPEIPKGTEWGDIIPPYTYNEVTPPFVYPGQNWTAEGQAIWENGCNIPKEYNPAIDVSKTCPAAARIGDKITYSITVKNTGDEDLVNLVVNDPLLGGNLGAFPSALAPGEAVTKTFSYTVTGNDPDPLTNTVTASAKGKFSDKSVSDSDSCNTDITHEPGIDVSKTCPPSAKIGEQITYTIKVTNTGDEPLTGLKVDDSILGDLSSSFPDTLAVGGSVERTFKHTVVAGDDPVHNEVTATATGADSKKDVSDSDFCDTDVQHEPGIDVTKACTPEAGVGDEITYTITVTNTGNEPLTDVKVIDTVLGDISGSYPSTLAVGQSVTESFKHTVTVNDPDPLVNKVTASGTGEDSKETVSDQDECKTDITHEPGIDVTKSCPTAAKIGDTITYTITVKNTGDEPLENVKVTDSLLGDISGSYPSTLAVGQSVTKDFNYTVTAQDPDPLPNKVTASGTGADSGKDVEDADECKTDITHEPGIEVTKSCPAEVPLGGTITYSITVKNTGDEPLENVVVNDPLLGGDLGSFPSTLAVGESVTKQFTYDTSASDPDPLSNEVTASGTGVDSGKDVEDADECKTDITHEPGIEVTKSCPASALPGEVITYYIEIKNTGNEPLEGLKVDDTLLGDLSGDFPDKLAVGESVAKEFTYTVKDDVDPVHNEVTASAKGVDSQKSVEDSDSCDTDVKHTPGIEVTKSCPATGLEGDVITYNITVKNTGDEPLENVVVNDPLLGGDLGGFPSTLAVGESATRSFQYTIPADVDPVVNEVSASGVGVDSQQEVADTDTCETDVHHPAIELVKTANPVSGSPGDVVTYTYVVTNTGDVTLFNISVDDDKLGHIGDIPSLAPGASATLTKDYVLPNLATAIINVAVASGCDEDNHCVSDEDDEVVTVVLGERERKRQPPEGKVERGGVLPFTGSDSLPLFLAMSVLLIAGVAFSRIARRRRGEA